MSGKSKVEKGDVPEKVVNLPGGFEIVPEKLARMSLACVSGEGVETEGS